MIRSLAAILIALLMMGARPASSSGYDIHIRNTHGNHHPHGHF
jgi:hypothetical protein